MPYVRDSQERIAIQPNAASLAEIVATLITMKVSQVEKILKQAEEIESDPINVVLNHCKLRELSNNKINKLIAAVELGRRLYAARPLPKQIGSPQEAADALSYDLTFRDKEKFAVLVLDVRNSLLACQTISEGTATETLADPKEIFGAVMRSGGTRCLVAHNHPSNNCGPSPQDIALTEQVLQAGQILNIPVLDHLVMTNKEHFSFRESMPSLWEKYPQGD